MPKGPKKGSKRYVCRNEGCERNGKIQYIQPWAEKRCKSCGSENIEEVTPTPKPPGLAVAQAEVPPPAEPEAEPTEPEEGTSIADVGEEAASGDVEPPAEPEPPAAEKPPTPERTMLVRPKDGDLVACRKCGWAVFWDSEHHKKIVCGAAACGSTDLEIKKPVEGK